jgi:hypothetical protein
MIVKTTEGFEVRSEDGTKKLSADNLTKGEAAKRLGEIEYFKHKDTAEGQKHMPTHESCKKGTERPY